MKNDRLSIVLLLSAMLHVAILHAQPVGWDTASSMPFGYQINGIVVNASNHVFLSLDSGGVIRSTDFGDSWQTTALFGNPWGASGNAIGLHPNGTIFIAGIAGVYTTTNEGDSWVPSNLNQPFESPFPTHIAIRPSGTIFVSAQNNGLWGDSLFRSIDCGSTWTGSKNVGYIESIALDSDSSVYLGVDAYPTQSTLIFRSTDNGAHWDSSTFANKNSVGLKMFVHKNHTLLAGTWDDTYRSVDSGKTWSVSSAGLAGNRIMVFTENSLGHIFAGTFSGGVFRSLDDGLSWEQVGLVNYPVRALAVSVQGYLFAGAWEIGVFRTTQSTTSIEPPKGDAPLQFRLFQNYPNPFNPSTTIRFSVSVKSHVRVSIYNVLGEQIAQLTNEEMNAGHFERIWNANVASGLYFYRLEAVSVSNPAHRSVDVKKMLLLK